MEHVGPELDGEAGKVGGPPGARQVREFDRAGRRLQRAAVRLAEHDEARGNRVPLQLGGQLARDPLGPSVLEAGDDLEDCQALLPRGEVQRRPVDDPRRGARRAAAQARSGC